MDKNWRTEYERILSAATEIALATSVDGIPNVRIVNLCRDPNRPETIYFSTYPSSDKVAEFAANDRIAFTTIPRDGTAHVRTRDATVRRSGRSIGDMKALFLEQVPGFDKSLAALEAMGGTLDVYEIRIREAVVVTGFDAPGRVKFPE